MHSQKGFVWKFILIGVVFILGLYVFLPNWAPWSWLPKQKLNYGLDIQGGLHLVMGIDRNEVLRTMLEKEGALLRSGLQDEGISIKDWKTELTPTPQIMVSFDDSQAKDKAKELVSRSFSGMFLVTKEEDKSLGLQFVDFYIQDYFGKILSQAIETVRNRIDEFGVAEPVIAPQGEDRILVQLPGVQDTEAAKGLISSAAKLDFMLVEDKPLEELQAWVKQAEEAGIKLGELKYTEYVRRLNEFLKDKLPPNTQVLFEKMENVATLEQGRIPYLLRTDTGLDGSALDDARVSFNQFGRPEVALRFNALGANAFRELTGKNVGRRLAIVLDKVVKTAPNIQTEIGNGQAVITLGGAKDRNQMMEEAKMIATTLRAGALPVALEQLEERRIGPTLGMDSLKKAEFAAMIGALGVIAIMIIRYKVLGLVSVVALLLNVMLILAALTSFKATLTLPGIAGIALTVGVAVDANVLIFERIREELARGASWKMALAEGYQKALSAILDANVVVGATSVILLFFGSGPIRGFAVTLLTGIVTTLFAQVFSTAVFLQWLLDTKKVSRLSV
jgi:preprotein translocase subunit SecD